MLSIEKARALKKAGLAWGPKVLDRFYDEDALPFYVWFVEDQGVVANVPITRNFQYYKDIRKFFNANKCIFAPRLDQLLQEIERRGYSWGMVYGQVLYMCRVGEMHFDGDTADDAAADALLWVLGQAKGRTKVDGLPPEELRCHWLPGRECHNAQCRVNPAHKHTCKNEYFRHHQEQAK